MSTSPQVTVVDVAPRDGLQNEPTVLAPLVRAQLCNRLAAAGLTRVETASFVNPKLVPSMAGAEEVLEHRDAWPHTEASALVLNGRGLERAVACNLDVVNVAYPVTDTFSLRNQNASAELAAETAAAIIGAGHAAGLKVAVTLAASFGCPFEGEVDPGVVVEHARLAVAAGADEITLADTIGVAVPGQVRRLVTAIREAAPDTPLGLHLHNTRNTGYANAAVALEHDVAYLESSIGGIGGCPFAPRATGNIATEDLLYLLEREGIPSGVDLDKIFETVQWLSMELGRELPGLVHKAGWFPNQPSTSTT